FGIENGEQAHLAALEVLQRGREADDRNWHVAAKEVVEGRSDPAIRHIAQLDARHLVEHLAVEMMRRAEARGGVSEFAWLLAYLLDELRHGPCGNLRIDEQACRVVGNRGNRRKIPGDVEGRGLVLNAVNGLRERDDDADGIAIGLRALDHGHPDSTRGTRL